MSYRADLSDANLLTPTLPRDWQPLSALIGELDALVSAGGDDSNLAQRREQAKQLRDELLARTGAVLAGENAELAKATGGGKSNTAINYDKLFADAVLLWSRFADAGGRMLYDTFASTTLSKFPIDWVPDDASRDIMRMALSKTTGLSAEAIAEREEYVAHLSSKLSVKLAITATLKARLDRIRDNGSDPAYELFRLFYGSQPFRPGDIDLVCTSSRLFFCIPMGAGDTLADDVVARDQNPRTESELSAFFKRVRKAATSAKNLRSPAVGLFDIDLVDGELLSEICQAVRRQPGLESSGDDIVHKA